MTRAGPRGLRVGRASSGEEGVLLPVGGEHRGSLAQDADPRELGGWGWRVVPEASPCCAELKGFWSAIPVGDASVVTVDDSTTWAGLINGFIARSAS